MVRVYTRTGDAGETALFDGSRVAKSDLRVEAYGTVDELNSTLTLARLTTPNDDVRAHVREIQRYLFIVGGDLATPRDPTGQRKAAAVVKRVTKEQIQGLEALIDTYWGKITDLDSFVVPGETIPAGHFHVARCVCRRAERLLAALASREGLDRVGEEPLGYLNRLSDLLFTWGRYEDEGVGPDTIGHLRDD